MNSWAKHPGFIPHALFMAASFNGSATYHRSFVNLSAHLPTLKVMYGEVFPMLNKIPFAIINNITVIQYTKPLEQ